MCLRSPFVFCLSAMLAFACTQATAAPRVVFINPDAPGNLFWDKVTDVMHAAALDLGLSLEVRYGEDNRELTTQQALDAIDRETSPDYLIYIYQIGQGKRILQAAEKAGVYSIIFNTDIPPQDQSSVGEPGQPFARWLAHLTPDDQAAGRDLASYLIDAAGKPQAGKTQLVGFNGGRDSSAARLREEGLNQALLNRPEAELLQVLVADWDPALSARQAPPLLRRWPSTRIVWSASDATALSAAKALKAAGYRVGKDLLIGSIDWTDEGLKAVEQGSLKVTFGGHFMEGVWALVLAHDHAKGLFTADETRRFSTNLAPIDASNVHRYKDMLTHNRWDQVDFRQFSRERRGKEGAYDFRLPPITHLGVHAPYPPAIRASAGARHPASQSDSPVACSRFERHCARASPLPRRSAGVFPVTNRLARH